MKKFFLLSESTKINTPSEYLVYVITKYRKYFTSFWKKNVGKFGALDLIWDFEGGITYSRIRFLLPKLMRFIEVYCKTIIAMKGLKFLVYIYKKNKINIYSTLGQHLGNICCLNVASVMSKREGAFLRSQKSLKNRFF